MDLKQLKKLSKLAREFGILKIKQEGLEIDFSLNFTPIRKVKGEAVETSLQEEPTFSTEDTLFWSSTQNAGLNG